MTRVEKIAKLGTSKYWKNFDVEKAAEKIIENIKNKKTTLYFWEHYRITLFLNGNLKKLAIEIRNLGNEAYIQPNFNIIGFRTLKIKNSKNLNITTPKVVNTTRIGSYIYLGENWRDNFKSPDFKKAIKDLIEEYVNIRLSKSPLSSINIELEGVFKADIQVYVEGISANVEIIDNDFYYFKEKIMEVINNKSLSVSSKITMIEQTLENLELLKPLALIKDKEPILEYKLDKDTNPYGLKYYIEDGSLLSRNTFNKIKNKLLSKDIKSIEDRKISLEFFLKSLE